MSQLIILISATIIGGVLIGHLLAPAPTIQLCDVLGEAAQNGKQLLLSCQQQ